MTEDKKTIGLTAENKETMEKLMARAGFRDQIDAAKCAMAVAINAGLKPQAVEGAGTTWNVGSFDASGELRALIPNLFPDVEAPYRAVESLVNDGLRLIAAQQMFDLPKLLAQGQQADERHGNPA